MSCCEKSPGRSNYKTGRSFDLTTRCLKMRQGSPCEYCYVAMHREKGDMFKTEEVDLLPYDRFVLRYRQQTVDDLNAMGGIRMFSSGDYLRTHRRHVADFLNDCFTVGLSAKAITKNVHFIYEMHDFPALRVINLSIDRLGPKRGSPVAYQLARKLKDEYHKVRIRCVALTPEDLKFYGEDPEIDVITLNHGSNGFYQFSDEEREQAIRDYPSRICCVTGKCATCKVKCGARENIVVGKLIKPADSKVELAEKVVLYSKKGCPACEDIYKQLVGGEDVDDKGKRITLPGLVPVSTVEVRHIPDMTRPDFAAEHNWRADETCDVMAALADNDMQLPVVHMKGQFMSGKAALKVLTAC